MSHMKMTDIYNIRPKQDIIDMTSAQKHQLLDAATSTLDGNKKGLIITFDLSSSFRRTNNRIYSAAGQRAGISSWTKPYPKPILVQHNRNSDPIGRIISVEWVSNDQQAMRFFESMNDFMQFKRIADTGSPQKIYKAMLKYNLFTNDAWPGLGKLVAKARISDSDAIEKFLDGRYLTFSAGSHTDKYCCGICGSDWAAGDICEHPPGSISDEGLPAIYFTGKFEGDEASVVTIPGNGLMQLVSMEFGDSVELSPVQEQALKIDGANIQFTDASVDIGEIMAEANNVQAEVVDESAVKMQAILKQLLADETALAILREALADKEIVDADNQTGEVKGSIQAPCETGGDQATQEVAQEVADKETEKIIIENSVQEDVQVPDLFTQKDSTEQLDTEIDVSDVDWYLLSAALDFEIGDAKLSTEAREKLEADAFCGPDRSFPVPDCTHVTAARRLIGRAKLSADQKKRVLACVDRKAQQLSCNSEQDNIQQNCNCKDCNCKDNCNCKDCNCKELQIKLDALLADYQASLELATQLQDEVNSLKEKLLILDTPEKTVQNNDSNTLKADDIKAVEDESVSSSNALAGTVATLDDYKKKIVSRYKKLQDEKGDAVANRFLHGKIARGHLPKTFDITLHIQENE